jgi:hypothetical protein
VLLATLFLAAAIPSSARASLLDFQGAPVGEILLAQRSIADTVETRATNPPEVPFDSIQPPPPPPVASKSAGKAFLYSLAMPGAGHLYAGYKRGWVNIGVEGLSWLTYFYYRDRGNTKEDEFEAYADDNWDYDRWISQCGCQGSPEDSLILGFRESNKQQYYEDIGKISTYFGGWEDYNSSNNDSANRRFYRGIRNDSNNFLKNANYALAAAFVNRIVSAVDVLRLVKKRGSALQLSSDTSLFIRLRSKPFSRDNAIGLQVSKRL